ncbi:MAG: hypothetical protein ACFFDH_18200 [Promethearchaeota archaeon]
MNETRTTAVCEICNNFIYKQIYYDENSAKKEKTIFVCKNCLENGS